MKKINFGFKCGESAWNHYACMNTKNDLLWPLLTLDNLKWPKPVKLTSNSILIIKKGFFYDLKWPEMKFKLNLTSNIEIKDASEKYLGSKNLSIFNWLSFRSCSALTIVSVLPPFLYWLILRLVVLETIVGKTKPRPSTTVQWQLVLIIEWSGLCLRACLKN